eukprot:m.322538 g.322538  ORF g.322538 m.322538 type:complete len:325 (-) comp55515_c0_seq27:178-1152(-)
MIAALVLPPSADTRAARQSLRCVLGGGPGREHPRQPCPSSRRGGPARLAPLGPASILRTHGPSSVAESRHVLVRPEASRRPMVEPSRCDRVIVASVSVIMVFFLSCSSLSTLLQSRPNACCSDSTHSSSKDDSLFSGSETEEADVNSSSSEEVPPVGMRPHRRPACRASPYGVDRSTRRSSRKPLAETTDSRPQEAAASSSDLASQARLVICDSCNHRCVQRQDPASFVWFRDLAGKDQGALLGARNCQVCGGDLAALPVRTRGYMCHVCNRNFRSSDRLIAHAAKHNGRKAFSCADCGKSFSRQPRLVVHQQRFGHSQGDESF